MPSVCKKVSAGTGIHHCLIATQVKLDTTLSALHGDVTRFVHVTQPRKAAAVRAEAEEVDLNPVPVLCPCSVLAVALGRESLLVL